MVDSIFSPPSKPFRYGVLSVKFPPDPYRGSFTHFGWRFVVVGQVVSYSRPCLEYRPRLPKIRFVCVMTTSGIPACLVAMTGKPDAPASKMATGVPSVSLARVVTECCTKARACCIYSATCFGETLPVNVTA